MKNEHIKIQDNSGDKDCFTIVPNFVLNHSSANDQSLYLQMKKFAGEKGNCFASQKTLMKKMQKGRQTFNRSLKYLIEKKWISCIGTTLSKTRPIKTYKINNIWKINTEHYKKIPSKTTISLIDNVQNNNISIKDNVQNGKKITSKTALNKIKVNKIKKEINPPLKLSKILIDILLKEMKLARPDGDYKMDSLFPAQCVIKYLVEYSSEKENAPNPSDKRITTMFTYIIQHMDEFHKKNATNIKYIKNNFNKIINTLTK